MSDYKLEYKIENDIAKITFFYVKHNSQNKGIGTEALNKFIDDCKQKGIRRIEATIDKNVIQFYKKMDFTVDNTPIYETVPYGNYLQDYVKAFINI